MAEPLCPAWLSFALTNVFRRAVHDPARLLRPFVSEGDTVVDVGCGPGFFIIPMARLVGPRGRVVAVDIQPEMLEKTRRRAERAGVGDRVRLHLAGEKSLGLDVRADFALVFWMAHEVDDLVRLFRDILETLTPEGICLLVEPRAHVPAKRYEEIVAAAVAAGFEPHETERIRLSRAAALKPSLTSRTRAAADTGS
jgi:ubiquinone/menaquinone biosynthesis C-methylase UbiE